MSCNSDFKMFTVAKNNLLDIVSHLHGEISHSYRVVSIKQPAINLFLCRLESSTCNIGLSNRLNLLQPILITKLIKGVVNLIQ